VRRTKTPTGEVGRGAFSNAAKWAQILYPNVAGFVSQRFLTLGDEELPIACLRADNAFLAEWCSADPDRLLGVMATPFSDVEKKTFGQ
jgi:hypothetical protein